ncbi:hypothetical protein [Labedaea rhizosphaerae]|uniref:Uncharacterized protein n=1 Tax=Labedaea rhizosphaerae TaxID=598644 RepID=A0A4R6SDM3_LABRH|nr:hypothetical protein [Labedaea rhizosphaerae]TDP97195.1 hypothetical protein EV186_103156 [Labedaea rhizosphaerae]
MRPRFSACVAALAIALAGCESPTTPPPLPKVNGWQEIAPPAAGVRIVALANVGDRLMALGSVPGPDGRAPAAWTTTDGHGWRPVALHPVTGYGEQAEFTRFAVLGDRILVWGMAFGGAHSNPRPTSWAGDAERLTEYEQPMERFGGPHAVGQYDEAGVPGTGVIVGQWDKPHGGYGAAVWTSPDGATWTRGPDDPVLSGAHEQTSAEGVSAQGNGFLIVGNAIGDTDGVMHATAWSSPDGKHHRRLTVPDAAGAEAVKVACAGTGCAIVGARTKGRRQTVCWPVHGPAIGRPTAGPTGDTLDVLQVLVSGKTSVLLRVDGGTRLFALNGCLDWRADPLPVTTRDARLGVLPGGTELLATTDEHGSRLWTR